MQDVPVLIVGGGPVGLAASFILSRLGGEFARVRAVCLNRGASQVDRDISAMRRWIDECHPARSMGPIAGCSRSRRSVGRSEGSPHPSRSADLSLFRSGPDLIAWPTSGLAN